MLQLLPLPPLTLLHFSLWFLCSTTTAGAAESAWNGHTDKLSTTRHKFTPFYVPPGSTAYDLASTSQNISLFGTWHDAISPDSYNQTALSTSSKGAKATFDFSGTSIELYGSVGARFGAADVYVDENKLKSFSAASHHERQQQLLFFTYTLVSGTHKLTVINRGSSKGSQLLLDAAVVTDVGSPRLARTTSAPPSPLSVDFVSTKSEALSPNWSLIQRGSTGVAAMQLAIISASHAIIIDKVEHNPLTVAGHPAWGALYNLDTHEVKPLDVKSNSFCAGGTFLSNGTLINVGGNPVVTDRTSAADFGDVDGMQAIRLFHPCQPGSASSCEIYENHSRIRMASPRWYNTVLRLNDGSAMIIGGSKKGGWMNNATTNNPTVEYFPPKSIHDSKGLPIHLPFLVDTLNANLFPIVFALPDGKVFVAANRDAMIYDWRENTERRLPQIPNGIRVTYPMTGTGLLLPLSPENNYAPEVILCGGSNVDDTRPGYELSSSEPASAQCSRLLLTDEGIAQGWQVENMPEARMMPDAVLLPTGQVLIINGGTTGISGYGNVKNQVGQSNTADPVFTATLYDPRAASGSRFAKDGIPASSIARLYHSTATLTPRGDIMIAGSNPNLDRSEELYGTEYRVEWLGPPYMSLERPVITSAPEKMNFGETVSFKIHIPTSAPTPSIQVACMDLGFVTHSVHANTRLVYLVGSLEGDNETLHVTGPPNGGVYPPGPSWIYVLTDGVPSVGVNVMIGDGSGPKVDAEALENVLKQSQVD